MDTISKLTLSNINRAMRTRPGASIWSKHPKTTTVNYQLFWGEQPDTRTRRPGEPGPDRRARAGEPQQNRKQTGEMILVIMVTNDNSSVDDKDKLKVNLCPPAVTIEM